MRQIPLALGPGPAPSFDSYLSDANAAAVAHLRGLAHLSAPVYLWGDHATGKTHLLRALALQQQVRGHATQWFNANDPLPWVLQDSVHTVLLDDCQKLDAEHAHAAFAMFELASAQGTQWVASGTLPPVDLPLRDDLRTRLGWGHVFALRAPTEPEVRAAMRREADRRGIFLSDEVMGYVLTRFDRDLAHLMALLDAMDEFALAHQRGVTVPLLKQMLAEREHAHTP